MPDGMEYDPEKALWRPGRRSFFFGLGAALAGAMLPDVPGVPASLKAATGWESASLKIGDTFTMSGVYSINPPLLERFRVKSVSDCGAIIRLEVVADGPSRMEQHRVRG